METLTQRVKAEARAAGFDLVGITTAEPFRKDGERLKRWIAEGNHGGMAYLERNVERAPDPKAVVPQARSIVSVGFYYRSEEPEADASPDPGAFPAPRGRVSRYAWGGDYHQAMERRLATLSDALKTHGASVARYYVDTGPMLERAAAWRAGLGWFGKNTLVITRTGHGSFVFLGQVLTDLELEPDPPASEKGHCGTCTKCLDLCPTKAIVAPYVVDARKCIAYLTIEHRGPIPRELRPGIGDWVFGCDICQDVCPHNHRLVAPAHPEFAPRKSVAQPDLLWLVNISEAEYVETFRGSAMKRAKRSGLRRNAAVALGNVGDARAVPALIQALNDESDLVVRGHAAWALGSIAGRSGSSAASGAHQALSARLVAESDPEVVSEIEHALSAAAVSSG